MALETQAPRYTPSPSAPTYSLYPYPDEEVLSYTPRSRPRPLPSGVYTKKSKHATLVLNNQTQETTVPSYGSSAFICGEIVLHNREAVAKVELKLKGTMMQMLRMASRSLNMLEISHELWDSSKASSSNSSCPSIIPFSFQLPETFSDDGKRYPLPPTYEHPVATTPTGVLYTNSQYCIILTVTYPLLGFMTQTKEMQVPISYEPRTRPRRGTIDLSLLSSLKTQPDEWYQVSSKIGAKLGSEGESLHLDLFIPSVLVFALSQSIPFHLHISGSLESIEEFYNIVSDSCNPHSTSSDRSSQKSPSPKPTSPPESTPPLRVYILRQVVVQLENEREFTNAVIGSSILRHLPPPVIESSSAQQHSSIVSLDWEGELKCNDDVTPMGGFNSGSLVVKDFVMVEFSPPNSPAVKFTNCRVPQLIRLVTDPWLEFGGMT